MGHGQAAAEGSPRPCVQTRGSSSLMWDFKGLPQCNLPPAKANLYLPKFQPLLRLSVHRALSQVGFDGRESFNILPKSLFPQAGGDGGRLQG